MCLAIAAVLAVAALLQTSGAQTVHVVGDSLGWLVPPGGKIAYETWANMQTFVVGDVLDVARVTKEAFDSCNSTSPIFLDTTGPFNYTLDAAGEYYFIGTMDSHCYLGQKLAINVSGSAGPTPSPQAPTPTPPRGPVTYIVGDNLGWLVPPGGSIAYKTWAYGKTFLVGDVLVFNFANETQDVAVVTEEAYDSCNTTTTISVYTTSPVKYTLANAGEYFFTSTYSRHCSLGQKLAINVTASGSATPPSTTTTPTPSSNPSSSAPSPVAGGPSAPPPDSSAPARAVLGISSTLLLVALAFVH
ncbi:hypothetical protein BT93_C2334 [Corymbia citriodora subsp. variegata]|nr:hypothetical protein BT93_C2334 [Corymbia citriodora subsp. variegata]